MSQLFMRPALIACPACEYDLAGASVPTCPECGYTVTEDDI